jgi:LysR family transcriptional activator of nhaA
MALNHLHLRAFHAVATEGGVAAAARRRHVAPSALSVQVRALERALGHDLFERRGRAMHLTEAGRIALAHAETMFRLGDEIVSTLRGLGPGGRQVLRVGATATLSRNFQIGLLRPLLRRTDAELHIVSGRFEDLLASLDAHTLDVVLANRPAPADGERDLASHLIADQPASLVGGRARRLRLPGDLARVRLVLPAPGGGLRTEFDAMLARANIRPRVLAEVDDMAMLRLIARESGAVALVPPIVVADELASGRLVELARLPELRERFHAITARRRFPNKLLASILAREG